MMGYYISKDIAKLISIADLELRLITMFLINEHRSYYYFLINMADLKILSTYSYQLKLNETDSDQFQLGSIRFLSNQV